MSPYEEGYSRCKFVMESWMGVLESWNSPSWFWKGGKDGNGYSFQGGWEGRKAIRKKNLWYPSLIGLLLKRNFCFDVIGRFEATWMVTLCIPWLKSFHSYINSWYSVHTFKYPLMRFLALECEVFREMLLWIWNEDKTLTNNNNTLHNFCQHCEMMNDIKKDGI